jgi:hypothetical protein
VIYVDIIHANTEYELCTWTYIMFFSNCTRVPCPCSRLTSIPIASNTSAQSPGYHDICGLKMYVRLLKQIGRKHYQQQTKLNTKNEIQKGMTRSSKGGDGGYCCLVSKFQRALLPSLPAHDDNPAHKSALTQREVLKRKVAATATYTGQ